jgi:glyoxylase-like metal-dependent hydrolase (beta-lactamase superfamily II)
MEQMRASLSRLSELDKSITIYPGHGCSARLGDALDSVAYLL